uniref:EF-hand domain-containing protein n=1 Tax=Clastoptera arizonana TaxID=38151 RepID=A0A1B6DIZ8_9HEMI
MLISRRKVIKPGENLLDKDPPACYTQQDLFIGNTICLDGFNMTIIDADEYALRYMELHSCEYPKSNIRLVLDKVKDALKPTYKDFVARHFVNDKLIDISYPKFRESLKSFMKDNLTEHEIMTLARYYSADMHQDSLTNSILQSMIQNELKRFLYNDYERLKETFLHLDKDRKGLIDKKVAYNVLRGAHLPLDVDQIQVLLDRMCSEGDGRINYEDLIYFLDYKRNPAPSIQPVSTVGNLGWTARSLPPVSTFVKCVHFEKFISDLDLEKEIIQQGS